jgi:hypothetical protein
MPTDVTARFESEMRLSTAGRAEAARLTGEEACKAMLLDPHKLTPKLDAVVPFYLAAETVARLPIVAIDQFGKDHWSLFAYVESRCVDGVDGFGVLEKVRLRANPLRHPLLAHLGHWDENWGTRLHGLFAVPGYVNPAVAIASGLMLGQHDDWDCLDDLVAADLVETISLANLAVKMTPVGQKMAAELRDHKARGGHFAGFVRTNADLPVSTSRDRERT